MIRRPIALLALLAAFLLAPSSAFAATNLVQNGDLELGTTSAPTGWSNEFWGTLTKTSVYPVAGMGGGKAARTEVTAYTSGDAKWYFAPIPVTAGTTYQLSGNYRSNVATEVDALFMVNGVESYNYISAPASTGGAWASLSGSITAPAGATSMTVFQLIERVGYLEVDNISITNGGATTTPPVVIPPPATTTPTSTPPVVVPPPATTTPTSTPPVVPPPATTTPTTTPSGPNLIANGNLEAGSANAPTGWNADFWGTMTKTFTYPVAGNGGGKAAKVQVTKYTSGDAKWDFNHVAVSSHTIYKFIEDYTATASTNLSIEYKMQDGTYRYEWVGDLPASSGWSSFTRYITVPKGAVSLTVLHALVGIGSLTIDNASLVALPASPFPAAIATFVFDDGLVSQYKNALPILTAAGMKGGFYIITSEPASGNSTYMTWAQIKDLAAKGHEVGSHTRTHPTLTTLTAAQLQSEVAGSKSDLLAQGINPTAFVYPYGDTSATVEAAVKAAGYLGARGSYFGFNTPVSPRYNLADIRLDKTSTIAKVKLQIDQAIEDKRWIVFELHDVLASGGDEYAITTAFFQQVVTYLKQKNVSVVTLGQGLAQLNP